MTRNSILKSTDDLALTLFRNFLIRRDEELFELAEIEIELFRPAILEAAISLEAFCNDPQLIQIYRSGVRIYYRNDHDEDLLIIKVYGLMNRRIALYGSAIEYDSRFGRRSTLELVRSVDRHRVTGPVYTLSTLEQIRPEILFRVPKAHLPSLKFYKRSKEFIEEYCREFRLPTRYIRFDSMERLFEPNGPASPEMIVCSLLAKRAGGCCE